jgi:hypothetical protein
MEFTDYMLWKAGALVLAAFVWGIFCELTGRPLGGEPSDSQTAATQEKLEKPKGR